MKNATSTAPVVTNRLVIVKSGGDPARIIPAGLHAVRADTGAPVWFAPHNASTSGYETAPILIISSLVFITMVPSGPLDRFTILPLQIYTWAAFPKDDFRAIASTGIIVLLFILITMNSIAVLIRMRTQK